MDKIDRRHIYGIMLDTETANTLIEEDGRLDTRFSLPYDIGFAIIDSHGRLYETHSFVNADIFLDEKALMKSAYYAKKIPKYWEEIKSGKRVLAKTSTIRNFILAKIREYNIKFVCAHNARFDNVAMNNIVRWTTKSQIRYFFPYDIEFWDTLRISRSVMGKMPTYKKWCKENGYIAKNGQCRFTAEILYRFITKDNNFIEDHTGLEDVLIELAIYKYCLRQHKPMKKLLFQKS